MHPRYFSSYNFLLGTGGFYYLFLLFLFIFKIKPKGQREIELPKMRWRSMYMKTELGVLKVGNSKGCDHPKKYMEISSEINLDPPNKFKN